MKKSLFYTTGILIYGISFFSCAGEATREVVRFNYQYCSPGFNPDELKKEGAPIFGGLGTLDYKVTTENKKAQRYFNQGLTLAFAFNHGEAARSFKEAARLDPSCAMAWWGYAWVLGPNINASMDISLLDEANHAVEKAKALKKNLTPKEKMLVEAIEKRYPATAPADLKEMMKYSEAFAEEMRKTHKAF